MSNTILDYIGLKLSKIPKELQAEKPEFEVTKGFDNSELYKVYKKISPKKVEILISNTDRTTDIRRRYDESVPIQTYIKENKDDFNELIKKTSVSKIQELEEIQERLKKDTPYFVRYDKNYLWQIYYSKIDKKYFMLFPANEGESEVLFYMIKQKLSKESSTIFVPVCKEEPSEELLDSKKLSDIENYIWMFTKKWPKVIEIQGKGTNKLYITGETKIQDNLKSKYRVVFENKEQAEEYYNYLKALFIITTETKYTYKFDTIINKKGELSFSYNNEEITPDNLKNFISDETIRQMSVKLKAVENIKEDKKQLDELNKIIDEQSEIYTKQEKQIVQFMECKKSFFKRVKFFFKSNKNESLKNRKLILNVNKKIEETKLDEIAPAIDDVKVEKNITELFTIPDLMKTTLDTKNVCNEEKKVLADIRAAKLKQINLNQKIKNAENYIDEIESHKKNLFDFWRFTNKDNQTELAEGRGEDDQETEKKVSVFDLDEDMESLGEKADEIQRKKLSIDEQNAIFIAQYLLPSINSSVTKRDTYVIEQGYDELMEKYKSKGKDEVLFGGMKDDYTKVKMLKNKKHRENEKDIFGVLKFNTKTSLEDFKEIIRKNGILLNEAYQKITSQYDMPIFYKERKRGYVFGELNPYNLVDDTSIEKVYKTNANEQTHLVYMSNIIFYDNINKTLPLGMDKSSKVIFKVGNLKKAGEKVVNILIEKDDYNAEIRTIKIIEEE